MSTTRSAAWKIQPNSHVHFAALNRLSNSTTSRTMRAATPARVTGAGVVGILSGAGVRAYCTILPASPATRTAAAA